MENIISSLLNIKELMEATLQRFDVVQQHLDDLRASHDKMHQIFQLSFDELEDRICEIKEEDAVAVEGDEAKGEIKPALLTLSDVPKNPEPFPSFSELLLRTSCPSLHLRNYFFSSSFLLVTISNNYSPLSDSLSESIFEQSYLSQIPSLQTKHSIEVDDEQILSYQRFKAKAKMGINEEFLDDKVKRMRALFSRFSFDAKPSSSKQPTLEEIKSSFCELNQENWCVGSDLVRWIVGSLGRAPLLLLQASSLDSQIWNFDPGGVTTICLFTSSQLRKSNHSAETIIPARSLYSIPKSSSSSILFETRFRAKPSEEAPFSNDDSKSFELEHGAYSHIRLVIFDYNGFALIAMVGKNCLAIASDSRLGVQLQTIATDFPRIYKINDRLFLGLSGLATDAQTLYQRLVFWHKQHQRREGRKLKPETVANMLSALLDEKRFGPYFFQPVIAGLGDENKPILVFFFESSLDFDYVVLLGCVAMEDFPQTLRGLYGGTVVAFVLHMKKAVWVPQVFVKMPIRSVVGLIFKCLLLGVWCLRNLALQEKLGEIIDELVKCGLTERFPLVKWGVWVNNEFEQRRNGDKQPQSHPVNDQGLSGFNLGDVSARGWQPISVIGVKDGHGRLGLIKREGDFNERNFQEGVLSSALVVGFLGAYPILVSLLQFLNHTLIIYKLLGQWVALHLCDRKIISAPSAHLNVVSEIVNSMGFYFPKDSSVIRRTMLELLNQWDVFASSGAVKAFIATNRIESLDPTVLPFHDRKTEFPFHDIQTRRRIFQRPTTRMTSADDVNLGELVMDGDGFSRASIKAIYTEAGLLALRKISFLIPVVGRLWAPISHLVDKVLLWGMVCHSPGIRYMGRGPVWA